MTPRDQPDPRVGSTVGGRYRLDAIIGRGGMGAVYRAHDLDLGRDVAVKLFSSDGHGGGDLARQVSEVRLLASLNHPALVTLYDARVDDAGHGDDAYLVMELVEGPTLQDVLAEGPLGHDDAAALLRDVADGLGAVHRAGVVHRDVKPANILLAAAQHDGEPRRAKLADFGIAYLIDSTRVTATGTLMGTAAFVSPEQAEGRPPAAASDIYSLGLVLVEALTGKRVFTGSVVESVMARLTRDPEIPSTIGSAWTELLTRMTARAPEARPTAAEVAASARALARHGAGSTDQVTRVMTAVDDPTGALRAGDLPTRQLPGSEAATQRLPASEAATQLLTGRAAAAGAGVTVGDGAGVPSDDDGSKRRRRLPIVLAALALVALVAVGLGWALTRDGETPAPGTVPSPESTSEVEPSTPPEDGETSDVPSPTETADQEEPSVPVETDAPGPSTPAPSSPSEPTTDPVPEIPVPDTGDVVPGVGNQGNGNSGNGNSGNGNGKGTPKN